MSELRLSIAGLTLAVILPGPTWVPPLLPRLGKFVGDRPADLTVRLLVEPDRSHAPVGDQRVEEDATGLYLRLDNFEGRLTASGEATLTVFQDPGDPADLEKALQAVGATYTTAIYPDAPHGYTMSDTSSWHEPSYQRHLTELEALFERRLDQPS